MISQSITAVLLPAGVAPSGRPRANVYLSPRLAGAHLLSDFPDWLDWTYRVHTYGLSFELACGPRTATVAADTSGLRPEVWRAIFAHDSIVDAYPADDYDRRLIVSYPSRDTHAFLRWAYQLASTTPRGDIAQRTMELILSDLVFRDEAGNSTLDATLSQLRVDMWNAQEGDGTGLGAPPASGPSTPLTKPPNTRGMAERMALYHRLPAAPGRAPLPHRPHELERLIDFHQALTGLAAYPVLLGAVGLVVGIELPETLCPDSPAAGAYLQVGLTALHAGWSWAHAPALSLPMTAYARTPHSFSAAPATSPGALAGGFVEPSDIVDGFLALTANDFHLVGVELDGAMLKAMALADSLANSHYEGVDGLLPALRSGGLSLLADNRAAELLRAILDNKSFGTDNARALDARDLTRGYRLDIYSDRSGQWRSLHRRDGSYRLGDGSVTVTTTDEEGFTQLAVAQPAADPTRPQDPVATAAGAPQPGTDLYLNERVARWNGWSLSAPRPGTPLNRSPDPARATDPDPTVGQPVTTFKMSTEFAAHPGTLPSLRFGQRYRIRARAVDLAGHSVALSAAVADELVAPAAGMLPYYRYEPVPTPIIVLRALPGPGGSLAQMVIRTYNSDPALDAVPVADADERHIAPPRAAEQLVEHHGMLDDGAGRLRGDPATYEALIARDRAEIPAVGQTPLEPGPQLAVNYFADPLALGAVMTDLPQTAPSSDGLITGGVLAYTPAPGVEARPTSVTKVPFGPHWPEREAFRIRLIEGHGPPTWDDVDRVLTVALPKAHSATTALSCFTSPQDVELLGVWNWMRELFDELDAALLANPGAGSELVAIANSRTLLTQRVLDGGHEFITPSHPLTFTHAVQQPLGRPTFTRLPIVHRPADPLVAATLANSFSPVTAWRSHGSHHTVLLGALQINGASTAAIDLEATWNEWVDDVTLPAPTHHRAGGHVERITVHTLTGGPLPADGTGIRQVAVYIPGIDTLWFAAPFDELDGVDSPASVAAPVHQLGDTKHRVVRYRATASSRFQEYFPEPGTVCTRTGPALAVDVPSSARPLAPDIAYVVPLFGWESQVTTNTKTEVRFGNAVRVYLHRPWYSSGVGELLGVALWPVAEDPPTDDQREANKGLITQWGLDPAWQSGPLQAVPAVGDFPRAVRSGSDLTLQESTQHVDVAGHRVAYDETRRLWYCDIELVNPTAYAPFLRLALVRYQPRSIAGVECSHVALADFVALAPDRSAALTTDPADPLRARLVVAGLAPDGPTRSFFTATVEQRRPEIAGDLGWAPAAPAQARVIDDTPAPSQPESVLMSATVVFAHPPPAGEFRLVVREFEVIEIDPPNTALNDTPELGQRLVYAAILPIDRPLEVAMP